MKAQRVVGPHRFVRVYRVRENRFAHRRKLRVPGSAVFILSTNLQSDNNDYAAAIPVRQTKGSNCVTASPDMLIYAQFCSEEDPVYEGGDRWQATRFVALLVAGGIQATK